jgi:hypothetical protein
MTQSTEINTSVAMLVSVFGDPVHADHEANNYEWFVEFADGNKAVLRNIDKGGSAGRVQAWEVSSDSESGIAQVNAKLTEGENYYDGAMHPELFIKRGD